MDNVLAAFVILFLLVFAGMTLSEAMIASQDMMQASIQAAEERLSEKSRTYLLPTNDEPVFEANGSVTFTFRNAGAVRLAEFDQWDVIVQYFDDADPASFYIERLSYTRNLPMNGEWHVKGIAIDASADREEVFEPEILNPGEEISLNIKVSPPVGPGEGLQLLVAVPNGISVSTMMVRNIPPVLVSNLGLALAHDTAKVIDASLLLVEDPDGSPEELRYSVLTAPASGVLEPGDAFTQADIDAGLLEFTSEGSTVTDFTFSVSDGSDVIGPFTFAISVTNAAVTVPVNVGLTMSAGTTESITTALLQAMDADDLAEDLTYTVNTMPSQGTLDPGPVFSQAHIDAGLLRYTHTGSGSDSFEFIVSDGVNSSGPYTFEINVP
jgi:hypothetical protein